MKVRASPFIILCNFLGAQAGLHARTNKNSHNEFFTAFALYHTTMPIANVFYNLSGCFLFVSPDDSALCQVIGGHLKGNFIARKDPDEILSQLSADMSKDDCSVFQFYAEKCIGEFFNNNAFEFNNICF